MARKSSHQRLAYTIVRPLLKLRLSSSIKILSVCRLRVTGNLPDLNFTASETRLIDILKLLASIPTPPPGPEAIEDEDVIDWTQPTTKNRARMKAILDATNGATKDDDKDSGAKKEDRPKGAEGKGPDKEQIQIDLNLVLKQV